MGRYEAELRQILSEGKWSAPNYAALDRALASLETALANMAQLHQDTWSGASGDAARTAYAAVMDDYRSLRNDLDKVERIFTAANAVLDVAASKVDGLPSTVVPQEIHDLVDAAASNGDPYVVVRGVSYAVDGAIHAIEGLFGNHRENDAKAALESMKADLQRLSAKLPAFAQGDTGTFGHGTDIPIPDPLPPTPPPAPAHHSGGSGGGSLPSYGGYTPSSGGAGGSGSDGYGSGGYDPGDGSLSVDDGSTGYTPGSSGAGSFAFGGGSAAAAALLRARTAGLGGPGAGLGSPVTGTGGLLGSGGASGATGAGASGAGSGAAAGGRGGMIGSGGAGAGKGDKAKRAGLGGAIAPKLEDDPEHTPLPEGARAGGRRGRTEKDS